MSIREVHKLEKEIQELKVKILIPLELIKEKEKRIEKIRKVCNHEFRSFKCIYINGYIISCTKCGLHI